MKRGLVVALVLIGACASFHPDASSADDGGTPSPFDAGSEPVEGAVLDGGARVPCALTCPPGTLICEKFEDTSAWMFTGDPDDEGNNIRIDATSCGKGLFVHRAMPTSPQGVRMFHRVITLNPSHLVVELDMSVDANLTAFPPAGTATLIAFTAPTQTMFENKKKPFTGLIARQGKFAVVTSNVDGDHVPSDFVMPTGKPVHVRWELNPNAGDTSVFVDDVPVVTNANIGPLQLKDAGAPLTQVRIFVGVASTMGVPEVEAAFDNFVVTP